MKGRMVSVLLFALMPAQASAGANSARLRCVTTSAAEPVVRIEATIPRDIYEFRMRLEGPQGTTTLDESNASAEAIEDFRHGVFSLVVTGYDPHVILYALPKTVRHKSVPNGLEASFAGVLLSAPKPGAGRAGSDKPGISSLPISCVYRYEL